MSGRSEIRVRVMSVRVRRVIRAESALGVEGRIAGEVEGQIAGQIEQIRARVDPVVEVRYRDVTGGVNEGVGALDDHVAGGVDVDQRGVLGVRLHEPEDDGDVVGDALEDHGEGAVGLEEGDGAAVVVGVDGGFGLEAGVGLGDGDEVLADQPLDVFWVGQAALGEDAGEELLGVLRGRRSALGRRRRRYHCRRR